MKDEILKHDTKMRVAMLGLSRQLFLLFFESRDFVHGCFRNGATLDVHVDRTTAAALVVLVGFASM